MSPPPAPLRCTKRRARAARNRGVCWVGRRFPPAQSPPLPRHRSEQYLTLSQSRAHFLRHENGRAHAAQIFCGKSDLARRTPLAFFRAMDVGRSARLESQSRGLPAGAQHQGRARGVIAGRQADALISAQHLELPC